MSSEGVPSDPVTDAQPRVPSQSDVISAREQRSHIAIIQMAPPAAAQPSTSKAVKASGSKSKGVRKPRERSEASASKKRRHHCTVQGCTYNTGHTKDLTRHMRKHTGEKPFNCDRCTKSFTRYDKLVAHIRIHEGHKPFTCQVCSYSATDSSSLKKHQRTHSNERPYSCHICPYTSKYSSQLVVHIRSHTGDSPYSCTFTGCEAAFKTPSDLTRHTRLHTGDKPFKCPHCDYRAAVKSNLNLHMKRHSNPVQSKNRWQKKTNSGSEDEPEPEKSPETLPFQYSCKFCDFKADTIEQFTSHMTQSHPDFQQSDTSQSVSRKRPSKLKAIGVGEQRSFKCSYCIAAFVSQESLRCHMKQHGTVPNKPANVNPEIYSPVVRNQAPNPIPQPIEPEPIPTPTHPIPDHHTQLYSKETEPHRNASQIEDPYTLHELQRLNGQSVITENPSVINFNEHATGPGVVQHHHYDHETGHMYVITYVPEGQEFNQNTPINYISNSNS